MQELADPFSCHLVSLREDDRLVDITPVVDPPFDLHTEVIGFVWIRLPPLEIDIEVNTHDFEGSQEAILDSLLKRVAVDRLTEVVNV